MSSSSAPRSAGWDLLGSELTVLFRRRRTWAMLVAIALIPILLAVAVRLSSETLAPGEGPPFLDRVTQNGLFVAFTAMIVAIPLFLPLTIGVVAGDTIAGEAGLGTLRYLLVAPAGRVRLLLVKYAGVAMFCLVATLTLAVAGTLIGAALFPVGPVTLLSGDTIGVADSLLRSALIALYVTVSLLGFAAIGLFISTLTDVPVGAMAATVVVSVLAQILDVLPQLAWLHPWLFSHYWLGFADLLRQPMDLSSFGDNALLQAGYIAVFGALAYSRFATKDILS
ncbi:ABC transporter permease [Cryobacterium sp. TMT1-21]|uniref:ABC transporter permease n=1 Tax=Cryobacterium shii TaxID=1259235 RepID=A0AAQ2C3I5_9MICO|nr:MULTISPECIES: ABC transporter permease subunit [Cryobacterium]TFC40958.1 ABC transporter permease [Cryobacterium shii]TFD12435.1 ABC transporter permease [Cryobacterium sp. TMT1-21]TFD19375.1 ABC transporter permease [Cryobacterium sp. TMT2-23]TFD19877.1 ABC transporter permease [Cryobacterium sp. TMT4-10]TFD35279.1 ABC transporter permease [Cryobacterium sp. TMT2-10]